MKRRSFLTWGAVAAVSVFAGHSSAFADLEPDRMWLVYRRHSLLIAGQRDDEKASAFAEAVVNVLGRFLPDSRAKVARATDTRRVGVLIGTNQLDVAVMAAGSAEALFLAQPPFDDIQNVPLRLVVSFSSHVLVSRSDFRARQAYLLAQTLVEHRDALPSPAGAPEGVVPAHRGSQAFFSGVEMAND